MTFTPMMARRYRLVPLVSALLVVLTTSSAAGASRTPPRGKVFETGDPSRIAGSYIVEVGPGYGSVASAGKLAKRFGGVVAQHYGHALRGFVFEGSQAEAERLAADPAVLRVEADKKVHLADTSSSSGPGDGIRRIYANRPLDTSHSAFHVTCAGTPCKGTGVVGAIIDTGVNFGHQEFSAAGKFADANPGTADLESASCGKGGLKVAVGAAQGTGHGNRQAGNFAAKGVVTFGVAPEARILPVKAAGSVSQVICGLDFITQLNTSVAPYSTTNPIRLLNMSLAWGDGNADSDVCGVNASAVHEAVCLVYNSTAKKVFITGAAGNAGVDVKNYGPGAYSEVFGVSAFCDRPARGEVGTSDGVAYFSNFGQAIDGTAPGCDVKAPEGKGSASYMIQDGTSEASPHVLGAAALLLQDDPLLTATDIRTILRRTGECPDGSSADSSGSCATHGQWPRVGANASKGFPLKGSDADGVAEPLVRAFQAVCEAPKVAPAC